MAVTLDVVGRTLANVLQMVTALETSSYFAMVFPLDEVDLSEMGGDDSGIAATLQLHYVDTEIAVATDFESRCDRGTSEMFSSGDEASDPAQVDEEAEPVRARAA